MFCSRAPSSLRRKLTTDRLRWQSPLCQSFSLLSKWSSTFTALVILALCLMRILARMHGFRRDVARYHLSLAHHSASCLVAEGLQVRSQLPASTVARVYVNVGGEITTAASTGIASTYVARVHLLQVDPLSDHLQVRKESCGVGWERAMYSTSTRRSC